MALTNNVTRQIGGDNGQQQYGAPTRAFPNGGTPSDAGNQVHVDYWNRRALIELPRETYFGALSDTTQLPRNFGKTIRRYHYMPLLDDRNMNDQGIDATGAVVTDGNLYGSSKDIGTIRSKIPSLSETGGRVNRVGFTRLDLSASIEKLGFFFEYSRESLEFDTDSELYGHIVRENLKGANEIVEDLLQVDLLEGAGVTRFAGIATETGEISGEGSTPSVIDYEDLQRMSITLDNNRTPKQTRVLTGSRTQDTRVVNSGRFLFVGSEMVPTLTKMADPFGNQAFVSVEHYAYSGDVNNINSINGEIGKIGDFRIIQVPEMQHWAGIGADATGANLGYRTTSVSGQDKYDVFPLLCVGNESFTTIGFQTDGATQRFRIINRTPGAESADYNDPYGETGFSSIAWFYATMILRSERLAVAYSVAEL